MIGADEFLLLFLPVTRVVFAGLNPVSPEKPLFNADLALTADLPFSTERLNIHTQLARSASNSKPKQRSAFEGFTYVPEGTVSDKFGVLLEQFGVVLDNNGVIQDNVGVTKTPQNRLLDTEKSENTKIPGKNF